MGRIKLEYGRQDTADKQRYKQSALITHSSFHFWSNFQRICINKRARAPTYIYIYNVFKSNSYNFDCNYLRHCPTQLKSNLLISHSFLFRVNETPVWQKHNSEKLRTRLLSTFNKLTITEHFRSAFRNEISDWRERIEISSWKTMLSSYVITKLIKRCSSSDCGGIGFITWNYSRTAGHY